MKSKSYLFTPTNSRFPIYVILGQFLLNSIWSGMYYAEYLGSLLYPVYFAFAFWILLGLIKPNFLPGYLHGPLFLIQIHIGLSTFLHLTEMGLKLIYFSPVFLGLSGILIVFAPFYKIVPNIFKMILLIIVERVYFGFYLGTLFFFLLAHPTIEFMVKIKGLDMGLGGYMFLTILSMLFLTVFIIFSVTIVKKPLRKQLAIVCMSALACLSYSGIVYGYSKFIRNRMVAFSSVTENAGQLNRIDQIKEAHIKDSEEKTIRSSENIKKNSRAISDGMLYSKKGVLYSLRPFEQYLKNNRFYRQPALNAQLGVPDSKSDNNSDCSRYRQAQKANSILPLLHAIRVGNTDNIRKIIHHMTCLNVYSYDGVILDPLGLAMDSSRIDVVKLLLDSGLNPNLKLPNGGMNPIFKAVNMNSIELVNVLLENGADIYSVSEQHPQNPIIFMAMNAENYAMVDVLLASGAKVNFDCLYAGKTPLHYAIDLPNAAIFARIAIAGGNIFALNEHKQTPFEYLQNKIQAVSNSGRTDKRIKEYNAIAAMLKESFEYGELFVKKHK